MNRRNVITMLWVAAVTRPFSAHAAGKRARVAVLTVLSLQDEGGRIAAFRGGMRHLGYIGGQTVDIDYRYADGDIERLRPLARELLALAPDVFFAGEPSVARAVKALAPDLPIVCPVLTDRLPDLFASYARPGGSVTGLASIVEGLHAKLVGLAHDVFPGLTRLGLLINPAGANQAMFAEQVGVAASARSLTVLREEARTPSELEPALNRMAKGNAQAVMLAPNGMFINERKTIVRRALEIGLPTIFEQRQDVEAGGFMSYGVNETEGSQRAAAFVDKILKGAKPGDLPIEFPTKIEMVINLKTAKALGVQMPLHLQQIADDVIE